MLNTSENKVDFKIKLRGKYNFEVSVSQGHVAIPRQQNGLLINFGCDNDFEERIRPINGTNKLSFENMNDILAMFKKVYRDHISYVLIDEKVVDWGARDKWLPLSLQEHDHI